MRTEVEDDASLFLSYLMYLFPRKAKTQANNPRFLYPRNLFSSDKSDYRVNRYTRAKEEETRRGNRWRGWLEDSEVQARRRLFLRRALIALSSPLLNSQPATVITRVLPRGVYVLLIMPDISSRRCSAPPAPLSRQPRFSQSRAPRCAPVRAPPCPRNFRPFRTTGFHTSFIFLHRVTVLVMCSPFRPRKEDSSHR